MSPAANGVSIVSFSPPSVAATLFSSTLKLLTVPASVVTVISSSVKSVPVACPAFSVKVMVVPFTSTSNLALRLLLVLIAVARASAPSLANRVTVSPAIVTSPAAVPAAKSKLYTPKTSSVGSTVSVEIAPAPVTVAVRSSPPPLSSFCVLNSVLFLIVSISSFS